MKYGIGLVPKGSMNMYKLSMIKKLKKLIIRINQINWKHGRRMKKAEYFNAKCATSLEILAIVGIVSLWILLFIIGNFKIFEKYTMKENCKFSTIVTKQESLWKNITTNEIFFE